MTGIGAKFSLGDPIARVLVGAAGTAVTAAAVRHDRVGRRESQAFRVVNELPDVIYAPVWVVMQGGNLAAAPVLAGAAWLGRDRRLAGHLLAAGSTTWLLAKGVKRIVNRPRPALLVQRARRRGREQGGLGYVSGHAAVSMALGAGLLPHVPRRVRPVVLGLATVVGVARLYVGAHLPLDVVGGAFLGVAVDGAVAWWERGEGHR